MGEVAFYPEIRLRIIQISDSGNDCLDQHLEQYFRGMFYSASLSVCNHSKIKKTPLHYLSLSKGS